MKTLLISLCVFALLAFTVSDSQLTDEERKMAVSELSTSLDRLMDALEDLTKDQLNYKVTEDSWSIAECVEHITISEVAFSDMLQGLVQSPADPKNREKVQIKDADLIAMMKDRSNKVKTQKPFEPTGKFGTHDATMETFVEKRRANIEYVKTTEDDLRNRAQTFPFGTVDGYQIILFMSAHSDRHISQMEEIMDSDGFPE